MLALRGRNWHFQLSTGTYTCIVAASLNHDYCQYVVAQHHTFCIGRRGSSHASSSMHAFNACLALQCNILAIVMGVILYVSPFLCRNQLLLDTLTCIVTRDFLLLHHILISTERCSESSTQCLPVPAWHLQLLETCLKADTIQLTETLQALLLQVHAFLHYRDIARHPLTLNCSS